MDIIEPSDSHIHFPSLLITKWDNTLHICIDFRELNKISHGCRGDAKCGAIKSVSLLLETLFLLDYTCILKHYLCELIFTFRNIICVRLCLYEYIYIQKHYLCYCMLIFRNIIFVILHLHLKTLFVLDDTYI